MEARYLERTAPWIERVGLKYVQEKIVDNAELRRSLFEDFLYAQSFAQVDPWAEEAGCETRGQKYNAMAEMV